MQHLRVLRGRGKNIEQIWISGRGVNIALGNVEARFSGSLERKRYVSGGPITGIQLRISGHGHGPDFKSLQLP